MGTLALRLPLLGTFKVSRRLMFWVLRILSLVLFLVAWQLYGDRPLQFAVAPPSEVLPDLIEGITGGEFTSAAVGTFVIMITGFLIAAVIGIGIGLAVASSDVADNTMTPIINAAYASPITLLIPIIGVYTGIDFWGKVFIVVAFAIFVIIINTEAGVRSVKRELIETAHSFSANDSQIIRKVVLPATTPYVLNGLRLGVARGFRGAIVADLLLAVANLGEVLVVAGSTFNVSKLLAGILFTTIIGFALMSLVDAAERHLTRWRPSGLRE